MPQLRDLCMRGCILADDVGFGKTKQLLLVAFLHIIMNEEYDSNGHRIYRPMLLVVPSTLIDTWIKEIRASWKGLFRLVVSYEDHDYKDVLIRDERNTGQCTSTSGADLEIVAKLTEVCSRHTASRRVKPGARASELQ